MRIGVLGAGAFGTALAIALARTGAKVTLWARDPEHAAQMGRDRVNARRLAGAGFPEGLRVTPVLSEAAGAQFLLLSVPMQQLGGFLAEHSAELDGRTLIGCAKGIDLATGRGPTALIRDACPAAVPAILTGPSFAADIAKGLPTALTIATAGDVDGEALQQALSTPVLRIYRTDDVIGAELGGALKNVVAIAAGVVVGAGLGDSARAALMTRGFAEMMRIACDLGARAETLSGLSGLGDLVLTCTSAQSRNFRFGQTLGAGGEVDPAMTVEGAATAKAVSFLAKKREIDVPVSDMAAALVDRRITVEDAVSALLSRPLRKE